MATRVKRITKIPASDEAWESGELGASLEHARRVTPENEQQLDDALGLQMISIRLPKALIEELKAIGRHQGLGYQPLVRQILTRFAQSELRRIAMEQIDTTIQPDPERKVKKVA
jgi:hypothetical protein